MAIGPVLKQARQDAGLTQAQAAQDICSQAMLSAIEHDQYTPNAALLIALCQRLGLSLDAITLANNFAIGQRTDFNQKVAQLCDAHEYQQLLTFLNRDAVIDSIADGAETQAYYYYLAVVEFQGAKDWDDAQQNLQLSLASATRTKVPPVLTRLAKISAAYIAMLKSQQVSPAIQADIDAALKGITKARYDENLNIIFYLAALIFYHDQQYTESARLLAAGIHFTTAHNSHYMLANAYYLLAKVAEALGQADAANDAQRRSELFNELFGEEVFSDFPEQ